MGYMKLTAIFTALSLATFNLYLSYFFRTTDLQFSPISIETANWFFLAKPTLNWGGFFIDGDQPSIHRLPTTLFLVLACGSLISYLRAERTLVEGLSAVILLGGLGGLTLDVLAFGSVCDWLGFSLPTSPIYSMLNISDLMILFSAPIFSIVGFKNKLLKLFVFLFSSSVIFANVHYQIEFLLW